MPPVAKTRMPARAAAKVVAETVVAPFSPRAHRTARSPTPTLRQLVRAAGARHALERDASMPTRMRPATTATVAGTAP